jgi:hypothetical protein
LPRRRWNPLAETIGPLPALLERMGIQGSPRIQGRSLAPPMDGKYWLTGSEDPARKPLPAEKR